MVLKLMLGYHVLESMNQNNMLTKLTNQFKRRIVKICCGDQIIFCYWENKLNKYNIL